MSIQRRKGTHRGQSKLETKISYLLDIFHSRRAHGIGCVLCCLAARKRTPAAKADLGRVVVRVWRMKLDTREVRPNVDEEMCYNFGRKHGVHPLHGHDLVQDFREKLEARDKGRCPYARCWCTTRQTPQSKRGCPVRRTQATFGLELQLPFSQLRGTLGEQGG